MSHKRFPIPFNVLISEIPAMLLGMAGFAIILTIVISLLYVIWRFITGKHIVDGLITVSTITFLVCFLGYAAVDFLSKKEGLLRRFILLRASGTKFLQRGEYDKAVAYLEESIKNLQAYGNPQYDFLLEQAQNTLRQAIEIQQRARQLRQSRV